MKTAILLISTGSPASANVWDVMKYLYRFLNDKRIMSCPHFLRLFLICVCILPFYSFSSAKRYRRLAKMYQGVFPLSLYCNSLKNELEKRLDVEIFIGMCFGKPLIEDSLKIIEDKNFSKIIILPMYPHYSSSASGIPLERAIKGISKFLVIPEIAAINSFFHEKGFITAFIERIKEYDYKNYDEIVFSYHSLPLQHVKKQDNKYPDECVETTKLICAGLGITACKTSFQSQMSEKWLGPSTKSTLLAMIKNGKTKVLVVAPSFVADCLETEIEIGIELNDFFLKNGGEELQMVKSLNDHPAWIDFLVSKFVITHMHIDDSVLL
jgi:ferrochelatase